MDTTHFPKEILNWINGEQRPAGNGAFFDKLKPADGSVLFQVARSNDQDISAAVAAAKAAQPGWAAIPPVKRGAILHDIVIKMKENREKIAAIVAEETGKSYKESLGETDGSIALALFYAGEGQRLYGRTTTSGTPNKYASTIRQPVGIAGLIVAANTPIANVAWKLFPALICGNSVILKAAEDTPATAWIVGKLAHEAGLPAGVCNIIQGLGRESGPSVVDHPDIGVISFTGSTAVGREIAERAGKRLAKVSLELGGKNPLVVCDDADLENAAKWVLNSSFSNAGQRCAASSRILIFDQVYDRFRDMLVEKTAQLRVGPTDDDDYGPVINERQLTNMLAALKKAEQEGAKVLCGGGRFDDEQRKNGFYMQPTFVENVDPHSEFSCTELFGPIAALYRVRDYDEALSMANDSPYGLTACIHTRSLHRAVHFTRNVQSGVAVVNAGCHGSEPHMPFGGVKQSGNGTREPGTEALDVYSDLKDVYINIDPENL